MYKFDLLKFDPIAYLLIVAVIALESYAIFFRPSVDSPDAQGIMQQSFRQNQIDRELLKATLAACSR